MGEGAAIPRHDALAVRSLHRGDDRSCARNGLKTIAWSAPWPGQRSSRARWSWRKRRVSRSSSTRRSRQVPPIFPLFSTRSRQPSPMSWWWARPRADAIAITRQMRELDVNVKMYGATPGRVLPRLPEGSRESGRVRLRRLLLGSGPCVSWEPRVRRGLSEGVHTRSFLKLSIVLRRLPALRGRGEAGRQPGLGLVRAEILKVKTKTVFGDFAVDERGYQIGHKAVTIQWQDGSPVLVWPDEAATGKPRFPTPPWSGR